MRPMLGAFTMHGGVGQTYEGLDHYKTPSLKGSILVVSEVDVACVFSAGSTQTSGYRYVPTARLPPTPISSWLELWIHRSRVPALPCAVGVGLWLAGPHTT